MVYLDYAATTPLDKDVLESMMPYLAGQYGNASSVHAYGRDARMAIERARNQIANALGVEQGDILFAGSASEANNLVIKGVIEHVISTKGRDLVGIPHDVRNDDILPEIVVSAIEHPCIMEAARHVEKLGWAKVVWIPVDMSGHVSLEDIAQAISDNTVLISVMYVNNEIGSVQNIKQIADIVAREKKRRHNDQVSIPNDQKIINNQLPIWLHTDAVQAIQYFDCTPSILGVDLMTIAPHKAYGPKGIGVLYKSSRISLVRQVDGGGQEYYLRAGTENVANVVGAGVAIEKAVGRFRASEDTDMLYTLRQRFCDVLNDQDSNINNQIIINNQVSNADLQYTAAPHIVTVIFNNCDAEALIAALDREGFAVSSGSACSAGVVKKSHVIEALNLGYEKYAPLRVSFGKETTWDQLEKFVNVLPGVVERIRSLKI